MELEEFVKNVLLDLVNAIEEARKASARDMQLTGGKDDSRAVEFDIAVTIEESKSGGGKAGIQVLKFVEVGGEKGKEVRNSTVSRIKFGVHIDRLTKAERCQIDTARQNKANQRPERNFAR